ncbi:hypothetical protein F2P81_015685 [Scophthalmus maximus]|uniref:Uncharacterized protein n=1 Tax=Scophthalmus maximus TaxID=52904 RepID=A0A6A4SGW6_SCOMX|nr:hypothetical protein F2P81_015685 [Scophthalmus maximus]
MQRAKERDGKEKRTEKKRAREDLLWKMLIETYHAKTGANSQMKVGNHDESELDEYLDPCRQQLHLQTGKWTDSEALTELPIWNLASRLSHITGVVKKRHDIGNISEAKSDCASTFSLSTM